MAAIDRPKSLRARWLLLCFRPQPRKAPTLKGRLPAHPEQPSRSGEQKQCVGGGLGDDGQDAKVTGRWWTLIVVVIDGKRSSCQKGERDRFNWAGHRPRKPESRKNNGVYAAERSTIKKIGSVITRLINEEASEHGGRRRIPSKVKQRKGDA